MSFGSRAPTLAVEDNPVKLATAPPKKGPDPQGKKARTLKGVQR